MVTRWSVPRLLFRFCLLASRHERLLRSSRTLRRTEPHRLELRTSRNHGKP
jgi:hypothetical protein